MNLYLQGYRMSTNKQGYILGTLIALAFLLVCVLVIYVVGDNATYGEIPVGAAYAPGGTQMFLDKELTDLLGGNKRIEFRYETRISFSHRVDLEKFRWEKGVKYVLLLNTTEGRFVPSRVLRWVRAGDVKVKGETK